MFSKIHVTCTFEKIEKIGKKKTCANFLYLKTIFLSFILKKERNKKKSSLP